MKIKYIEEASRELQKNSEIKIKKEKRFLLLSAERPYGKSREYKVFEKVCQNENGERGISIITLIPPDLPKIRGPKNLTLDLCDLIKLTEKVFPMHDDVVELLNKYINGYIILIDKEKIVGVKNQRPKIIKEGEKEYIIEGCEDVKCEEASENLLYCQYQKRKIYLLIFGKKFCVEDEYLSYYIENFTEILQKIEACNEIHDPGGILSNKTISDQNLQRQMAKLIDNFEKNINELIKDTRTFTQIRELIKQLKKDP